MEPNEAMKAMQINDDPLIEVIARAESEFYREPLNSFASLPAALAAAVRSFMGSDEVVERAAKEIAGEVALRQWADMAENRSDQRARIREGLDINEPNRMDCRDAYRAALSAAIGEPEGALRNPDA